MRLDDGIETKFNICQRNSMEFKQIKGLFLQKHAEKDYVCRFAE